MRNPFVHLNTLSDYSLGKSNVSISQLIQECKNHGMPAIALTDEDNLFGSLHFSLECAKNGIQPIIGLKLSVNHQCDGLTKSSNSVSLVVLLVKNELGYTNLLKLASSLYTTTSDNLSVSLEELFAHSEGLIALLGMKSPLGKLIIEKNADSSNNAIQNLIASFKKNFREDLYIELNRYSDKREAIFEKIAIDIAIKEGIPLVATNIISHISPQTEEAHNALLCIANNSYMAQENRQHSEKDEYFKSEIEMKELFSDIPEALVNSSILARKCSFMPEIRDPLLPKFANEDEFLVLTKMATDGLKERIETSKVPNTEHKKYWNRLEFELNVIKRMGFPGSFLIVSDFIKWSKANGIPVGPGRGSCAGSIVAWALKITEINPLKFGLIFERFLNPSRISLPDFDIDFCQSRRDEVINYVRDKYGESRVAHIITFGKLQARAVLRDVGRVLQMPYTFVDRICKMIPVNPANPVTLQEAIDIDKELQKMRDNDPDVEKLLRISLQLEGIHRNLSTHAAGLVIADRDIIKLAPLYKDQEANMHAVQYTMKYAEYAGLVKFDFLGLKTLTVIAAACELIQKRHNLLVNLNELELEDKKNV